jgi:hypothetical protein
MGSIECLVEAQHLVFLPTDDEARRLADVHLLGQLLVQESGLHVHVVDGPPLLGSKSQEQTHRFNPRDGGKHFVEVYSLLLDIALGY